MDGRYYEDLESGERFDVGSRTVTEAEIIEFATAFDPQPFHVSAEAAEDSPFGELVASGWHTSSLCTRLLVDGVLDGLESGAAIGIDDLRWRRPVRPGDTLRVEVEVGKKEPWDDRRGLVELLVSATNQDGETVLTRTDLVLVDRREGR